MIHCLYFYSQDSPEEGENGVQKGMTPFPPPPLDSKNWQIPKLHATLFGLEWCPWSFILTMEKIGTQFLGHAHFKISNSPILGQDELCNIFFFELFFPVAY